MCFQSRAPRIGLSADTYGKTKKALAEQAGVITRTERTDLETGHIRVYVEDTERFWKPAEIRRPKPRDYGFHPHCPDHPRALVYEVKTTTTELVERRTIERTYACSECGQKVGQNESAVEERVLETVERSTERFLTDEHGKLVSAPRVDPTASIDEETQAEDTPPDNLSGGPLVDESELVEDTPNPQLAERFSENTGGGDTPSRVLEEPPSTPACLETVPGNFAQELISGRQWVGARLVYRDGKWTKVPINPRTGAEAKANGPGTWGTVAEALQAKERYGLDGVGRMFNHDLTGIDLDHCQDPESEEIAE